LHAGGADAIFGSASTFLRYVRSMKIATFNINNVVRRLANLVAWLRAAQPDVVCLQELKATDASFPEATRRRARRSRLPRCSGSACPRDRRAARPGSGSARAPARGSRRRSSSAAPATPRRSRPPGSIYLPNGNPQPGPKFDYKLAWFGRLIAHAAELYAAGVPAALAGDYNVVPTDLDIYPTKSWANDALLQPESRAAFQRLLDQGWTDAIRTLHPSEPMYTFWDYKRDRWRRDAGLRLDHLLLSTSLARRLAAAGVDRHLRGEDGASDHAPAWIVLR
jgi:exodeoxyribonuclease-3